jgi:hypothetical protein
MRLLAEAQRDLLRLLGLVGHHVSALPESSLERTEAERLVLNASGLVKHLVQSSTEDMERKVTLNALRGRLTELEKILRGQLLMFVASMGPKGGAQARVALRFVAASYSDLDGVFKALFNILDDLEVGIQSDILQELGVKPKRVTSPSRVKAPKTYAKAQEEILRLLESGGWSVRGGLKIPHATSPDGSFRFWFKPQAIYYTYGAGVKDFGEARSMFARDYRLVAAEEFVKGLLAFARKYVRGV